MMDYFQNSHITALRYPGGSWGDVNDLMNFQFPMEMFFKYCKQMGILPTVSVRLLNSTPQAAADLVRYLNVQQKYGIVYWSIGNEPNLYAGLSHVKNYDTVRFNQEWRAFAKAMKAVDPSIKLLGPEISQFTGIPNKDFYALDANKVDWMTAFLKANGDLVDIVTYHRYPYTAKGSQATVDFLRQNTLEWTQAVEDLRKLIRDTTGRDIPIAVTEANSTPYTAMLGEATPDSFYNAIWWGDVLGRLINENIWMVNQWLLTPVSSSTDPLALIVSGKVRPTYYVYQMYSHFGGELVYARSGFGYVDVYAAKKPDGSLTVMVVNLTDYEKHLPLQIKGMKPAEAQVWLFDAKHNAADLGMQNLRTDGKVDLPAESITLYSFAK